VADTFISNVETYPGDKSAAQSFKVPKSRSIPAWARFVVFDLMASIIGLGVAVAIDPVPINELIVMYIFIVSYIPWFIKDKLYASRFISKRTNEYRRLTNAMAKAATAFVMLGFFINMDTDRSLFAIVCLSTYVFIALEREMVRSWFKRNRRNGTLKRKVVLVGDNQESVGIEEMISNHKYLGYKIVEKIDPSASIDPNELTTKVLSAARLNSSDGVIIAASSIDMNSSNRLIRDLVEAGIHVELSSTLADIAPERLTVRTLGNFPVVYIEPRHRHGWRSLAKRAFDLLIASVAVIISFPIFLAIAIAVKLSSKGPILFKQERVGKDGEPFMVLKFRTMVTNAEEVLKELDEENEGAGPLFKMKNDPRVTKVGSLLRKTSLDELPQLINVLKNEMSLVGPRPALKSEMADWSYDLYARLRVKPGITGMWQVSGRSATTFEQYTRLDLYYVDNWSLFIDISILAKTIPAVLKSDGAY